MNSLERFQAEFGARWAELTKTQEFTAAMVLLNSEKIQAIAELTDEEIAAKGHIILADLRGFLLHENGLVALQEVKKLTFQDLGEPTYPSPDEEARAEAQAGPEDTESTATGSISTSVYFTPPETTAPKPKRRKRRKNK